MKRLKRTADDFTSKFLNVNSNLYEEGTVETEEFIVKDDVIDEILKEMKWDGNSEYFSGRKSWNYYQPDEPAGGYVNVTGVFDCTKLEPKYGPIYDRDVQLIVKFMNDDSFVSDFIRETVEEFAPIGVSVGDIDTVISQHDKEIVIEATSDDLEQIYE